MIPYIETIGSGLLLYLLLCAIACLAGYGLLRLLGLATAGPAMLLLAPVTTIIFWSIIIGITVGLRTPMKEVTPWLWGMTAILALNGLRRPWPAWRYESMLLLLCAALPVVVMARYFWYGLSDYSGTITPDGWSYISYGQYLWEYQRGSEGGLAPLYQFGAYLSVTRYISAALLGFLSPLVSTGDTQAVSSLLQVWTLFCVACAVGFFWATETTKLRMIVTALVLSIVAGWTANLIWSNNFDNGLALVYIPAFAGIASILEVRNWRWWVLLGCMLASVLYVYPELAAVIIASAVLIALPRIWRERALWRTWLRGIAIALAVAFIFVLPALDMLNTYMRLQISAASSTTGRPGEGLFGGLLAPRFVLAAIWGLGGEHQIISLSRTRNLLAIALSVIAALGAIDLLRRRKWGLAAGIGLLLVGTAYFIIRQRYSYAAYKLIVIDWWGMVMLLVTGIDWIIERIRQTTLKRGVIGGFALLLLLVLSQSNHINADTTFAYINSTNQQLSVADFRQLHKIKAIVGSDPVILMVDEWLANEWAVYYLRDMPIHIIEYRMYMAQPAVMQVIQRAQTISPDQARYVLTDARLDSAIANAPHWQMVWSGGPYKLWQPKSPDWTTITNITNPNGIEQRDGQPFFWVGQGSTVIQVLAADAGSLQLSANMVLGPSLPNQPDRKIQIVTNGTLSQTVTLTQGQQVLRVPAVGGENTITLTALDKPSVVKTSNNNSQPQLLGIQGLAVALRPEAALNSEPVTITHITNPNGIEQRDGQPFFWVGQGSTVIQAAAAHTGVLQLSANMVLGPSLPDQADRKVLVAVNGVLSQTLTLTNGYVVLTVPVIAGANTITLTALDKPSVAATHNNDTRPLLLGIQGLTGLLWQESAHQIGQLILQGIKNPNGLEHVDGQQFLWVGQGTTVLHLVSNRAGMAQFSTNLMLGPSLPGRSKRNVQIATDHGYQTQVTVGDGAYLFTVPIAAGATDVLITALDTPSQVQTGLGDQRPLLLGMKGLQIWFQEQ